MQAKNSSILPTPAKPTAGRRGSALEWAFWRFDIDVYRDGTLIVTTPNNGSWPVRTCGLTTSAGDQVVLTKHEVEKANLPGYALFIVSDIALTRTGGISVLYRWVNVG